MSVLPTVKSSSEIYGKLVRCLLRLLAFGSEVTLTRIQGNKVEN